MSLELIIWKDIVSWNGANWVHDPEVQGLATFYTVGWVTEENDEYLTVYSTINGDGDDCYGHDTTIPVDVVQHRCKLKGTLVEGWNE
jgi:hypothetical protein